MHKSLANTFKQNCANKTDIQIADISSISSKNFLFCEIVSFQYLIFFQILHQANQHFFIHKTFVSFRKFIKLSDIFRKRKSSDVFHTALIPKRQGSDDRVGPDDGMGPDDRLGPDGMVGPDVMLGSDSMVRPDCKEFNDDVCFDAGIDGGNENIRNEQNL